MRYEEALRIAEERDRALRATFNRFDIDESGTIESALPRLLACLHAILDCGTSMSLARSKVRCHAILHGCMPFLTAEPILSFGRNRASLPRASLPRALSGGVAGTHGRHGPACRPQV